MTDTLVGGHLTRLGARNDVIVQKEFVSDLEKAAAKRTRESCSARLRAK
jgi:hypothetical protein